MRGINTDKFGGFHLRGFNLTGERSCDREGGLVGMGDQWELDAEDQMGDTLCICGKVFTNSNFAGPLLYFAIG